MSGGTISPREAEELTACFEAHARDLFGCAGVLTRGDQAQAAHLVQAAFEAAGHAWQVLEYLADEPRRGWLRRTLANIAVDGFRRETAFRDRLPRIEARYRKIQADPSEQAFSSIALEQCWQIILGLPQRQHAVALLRWQLDMKESEIATFLGVDEKTVGVQLHRVRARLIVQLGPEHPADDDGPEGNGTVGGADCDTGTSHEDALLSRLYHQVTELQEPRFSAGYDLDQGLARYRTWLQENSSAAEQDGTATTEWSADRAVTELYSQHYRTLVRLAAMLVRDTPTAEEVVQDAFVAMHGGWQRLRDAEKALAYLRQAVVNKSRSVLRHRTVVEKNLQKAPPDMPSAEHGAMVLLERHAVVAALRGLPDRQREAIVLRYYGDLSEADIAAAMGISRGAVKSHTSRGMAALRAALEQELW